MSKRKTTAEFIDELNKINPDVEVLGEYMGTHTKILCKCKVCENEWESEPSSILRGSGCPTCSYVVRGKNRKLSQEEFEEQVYANNKSVKIISKYTRMSDKVTCECLTCGRIYEVTASNVTHGAKCIICERARISANRKIANDEFLKRINNNIIVHNKYDGYTTRMKCECKICGNTWETSAQSLIQGKGCPKCGHVTKGNKRRKTHESFVEELAKINPDVKIKSRYTGANNEIECECLICGNTYLTSPSHLLGGAGCRMCYIKSTMNLDLTEEERISRRCYPEYTEFINDVLKRDDFTCQLTLNSGNVVVHHLDGYNWCVEKRTDVNNGITLSEEMHKEFHKRYGKGNNTKEQFVDFVNNLFKENRLTKSAYIWVMEERLKINNHLLSDRKEQK